jgi:glutamyl-tRNA reductase
MPELILIGLNHHTAPVAVRERVYHATDALTRTLHRLTSQAGIDEAAMLSTCNRVEVLMVCTDVEIARAAVLSEWADISGLPADEIRAYTYTYQQIDAIHHLMRVAAGLDSLILGETHILGQLAASLKHAQAARTIGATLNIALSSALHLGKRARTQTRLTDGARSVASAAAHLALRAVQGQACPLIGVVGVGEMGQAAARALMGRGVRVILMNRTDSRADDVARRLGVESHPWRDLSVALRAVDAVIMATSATQPVLTADHLGVVMHSRRRPLTVVDLAVPRAVEPQAADIFGLMLYDIDALRTSLDHAEAARKIEAAHAETLCLDAAHAVVTRLSERDAIPAIVDLRQSAHAAAQAELDAALAGQPALAPEARLALVRQTRRAVNQALHHPILALKAQAAQRAELEFSP